MRSTVARLRFYDGETYRDMTIIGMPESLLLPVASSPDAFQALLKESDPETFFKTMETITDVEFRLEFVLSEEDTHGPAMGIYRCALSMAEVQSRTPGSA